MNTVTADRKNFFPEGRYPITVRNIRGGGAGQHEHDMTDVRHTHNFAELVIVTDGCGVQWIDGEPYRVAAGDIFLIRGNTEHCFIERNGLALSNIMFDDASLEQHLKSLRSLPGYNALFLFEPAYRKYHRFQSHLHISAETLLPVVNLLHAMSVELERGLPGCDLLLLARTIEIFVHLSREYAKCPNPMMRSLNRLGEVISRLEREYREEWTIAAIARIAHMAPSTLIPVFRRATGYPPIDYLIRVRALKAAELLRQTNRPITEIALQTGFSDSNYFSRQFRRIHQLSPRDYRNRFQPS